MKTTLFLFVSLLAALAPKPAPPQIDASGIYNVKAFGADFQHVKAERFADAPTFALSAVEDFTTHQCWQVPDRHIAHAEQEKL